MKDFGYTHTSGSGVRVLSALTQFGLFETDGAKDLRKIWLSDLGKAIVWPNPREPEMREGALREAALRPYMHSWIYERFELVSTSSFPTDEVLVYDLINEMDFTEKAAIAFVKEFKETYEYSDLASQTRIILPPTQEPATGEGQAKSVFDDVLGSFLGKPVKPTPPPPPPEDTNTRELTNLLTHDKVVRLILPTKLNKTDFQILASWLDQLRISALYELEQDENSD
jgi:hypothetical protein